jgi:hypothetical protein
MVFTRVLCSHRYCGNYLVDWPESNGALAAAKVSPDPPVIRQILCWGNLTFFRTRRIRYEHVHKSRPTCAGEFHATMLLLDSFYVACLFRNQTSRYRFTPRVDDSKFCIDACGHHTTSLRFYVLMVGRPFSACSIRNDRLVKLDSEFSGCRNLYFVRKITDHSRSWIIIFASNYLRLSNQPLLHSTLLQRPRLFLLVESCYSFA